MRKATLKSKLKPPDPISHVCSLTGKNISRKYFTYRPVQISKIMFRRFIFSRIWSCAQDHALLVLLLNLVGFFISNRPRWSGGNDLYLSCTSFEGAPRGGPALKHFYIIHRGGRFEEFADQNLPIWYLVEREPPVLGTPPNYRKIWTWKFVEKIFRGKNMSCKPRVPLSQSNPDFLSCRYF